MKKNLFTSTLLASIMLMASCGGNGGSGGVKSVDIPGYATLAEPYFKNRETKTSHAWWGKADSNLGSKKFGRYTDSGQLSGMLIELGENQVVMLQTKSNLSLTKYLFEEDYVYSVQLIWHDANAENPHNTNMATEASMLDRSFTSLENAYCDSYYFYKDEEMDEARAWLESLEKQPNQKSKYDAKEEGGVKTYKAVIGKVVTYLGQDELKPDSFRSVYLDCGAVVGIHFKGTDLNPSTLIGKTIDCVTDADNKVIKYELN